MADVLQFKAHQCPCALVFNNGAAPLFGPCVFQRAARQKGFILQRVIKLLSSQFISAPEKTLSDVNVHLWSFHALTPAHTGKQRPLCPRTKVRSL